MKKTIVALVVSAGISGQAQAASELNGRIKMESINPVTEFNMAEKVAYCERLKVVYHAAVAFSTATAASVGLLQTTYFRASEARALAIAGGCALAPFAEVFLERAAPATAPAK